LKLQSAISASIQAGASLVTFGAAAFLAKRLGIEELGQVGLLLSLITLGGTVISLGIAEQVQFAIAGAEAANQNGPGRAGLAVQIGAQVRLTAAILAVLAVLHLSYAPFAHWAAVAACSAVAGLFSVITEISARVDFQNGHFGRGQIINSASSLVFWVAEAAAAAMDMHLSHMMLALLAWGVVVVAAFFIMHSQSVAFRCTAVTSVAGPIQGPAFVSRLLIAGGTALPFMVLEAAGARSMAGVLSLVSRLLGPIGIVFSSVTLAVQRRAFRQPQQQAEQTWRACKVQMLVSIGVALLIAVASCLVQTMGLYDLGIAEVRWWIAAIFVLLTHRGLSMAFQFSAQSLLPFFSTRQVAIVGFASFLLYLPLFLGKHDSGYTGSDFTFIYMFVALILQPLLSTLVLWRYSGVKTV
jgi:hypothetical protein